MIPQPNDERVISWIISNAQHVFMSRLKTINAAYTMFILANTDVVRVILCQRPSTGARTASSKECKETHWHREQSMK